MKKYRIKEECGYFYPQYKNGWRTLWSWDYFRHSVSFGSTYIVTNTGRFMARYLTLEEAKTYINGDKRSEREVIYHYDV